ncbi:MAG: VOC family protein [Motiliproteus sp.]
MQVESIDHLVLTVDDIELTVSFYQTLLGMQRIDFGAGRVAVAFGSQKINLHLSGSEFEPKAGRVQPGSADLCFIIDTPLDQAVAELCHAGVEVLEGPVERTGALGPIRSVYFRDPDGNLIELSNYLPNQPLQHLQSLMADTKTA